MPDHLTILHAESATGWGGQQMRTINEATRLIARGHRVMLACQPGSAIAKEAGKCKIPLITIPMSGAFDIKGIWRLKTFMQQLRPDIVHTHSSDDSWTALLAAKLTGGIITVRTRHHLAPIKNTPETKLLYRQLSDIIVANSDFVKEYVIERTSIPRDRVVTIYSGIDIDRFDPEKADGEKFRKDIGVESGAPLIGTVGMLLDYKGHEYLVDSAPKILEKVPDARFVIVGDVPSGGTMKQVLMQQIKNLGIEDKFILAGYRPDVPDAMAAFDIFVLPSTGEAFGQVVSQAMAMKKPVVAARSGGVPEQVVDGITGLLVESANSNALAEAVITLLNDPDKARQMGKKGRERVKEKFTLEIMVDKTEFLYRRLLKSRKTLLIK